MSNARPERAYDWVAAVLRWGSYVSAGLMLLGVALVFFQPDVPIQVGSAMPLGAMLEQLRYGNPYAVMQLGVVLLLLTPLARLMATSASFWLEGDRRYSLVSVAVLVIILASLLFSRASH
ncbi:MAG TPA: DUF1634 domain-containing protein [Candidatus Xenobia bacterium]|nr:DUF1634 domain-containing protein [Candidatus Xenobia bacterium]